MPRAKNRKMKMKEKEKEKIFVQSFGRNSEMYEIDMAKGCVKKLSHILYHCLNSITSIGSVIYAVGGMPCDMFDEIEEKVYATYMYSLDSGGEEGWKEIPPFIPPSDAYNPGCSVPNIPVFIPTAVSFGGKIYVFDSYCKSPSALVFNSNTNQWETLLPPPHVGFFDISTPASAVADPENNRLIISFKSISSLYAYYPSNNTWELVVDSFNYSAHSKLVFVNGVLYSYLRKDPKLVWAFDTVTKQFLEIEFTSELPDPMWGYKYADMLYLGNGLMCLVDSGCTKPPPGTVVSIAKFRFKRCTHRPGVLIITPLPLETYTIDDTYSSPLIYYPLF